MNPTPALFVTNMHRRFTGVSATAAAVVAEQAKSIELRLVGTALPGCPAPVSVAEALRLASAPPRQKPFSIWHVRRNNEIRWALFARDILRLPIRIVFTSAAQRYHSAVPRLLISRVDAVIATTQEAAGYVPHVRAVVPHGVDVNRFSPAPDRAAAWAATGYPGTFGLATVGRIRPEKGTDRFVDAMIAALPRLPGATALVVGRAAGEHARFLAELKGRVAAAGLAGRILFPGEVAAGDMPELMRALSLLVALPRYEGYGVTPLEAMASGVPVIASDAGHFRTFLGDGEAGIIADTPDEAAAATVALMSDTARHGAMAAAARARCEGQFGVAREAQAIAAVYDALWNEGMEQT